MLSAMSPSLNRELVHLIGPAEGNDTFRSFAPAPSNSLPGSDDTFTFVAVTDVGKAPGGFGLLGPVVVGGASAEALKAAQGSEEHAQRIREAVHDIHKALVPPGPLNKYKRSSL